MSKKKLSIESLRVQSFVTSISQRQVKAGFVPASPDVGQGVSEGGQCVVANTENIDNCEETAILCSPNGPLV